MENNPNFDTLLAAAQERWGQDDITDRTGERIKLHGAVSERGSHAIEYKPTGERKSIAVETARKILEDNGYDVYYRKRENGKRDPMSLIALPTENATKVTQLTVSR